MDAIYDNELVRVRLDKLSALKEAGQDPYRHTNFPVSAASADIHADFEAFEGKDVAVAGRVMSWRDMGKANFIDIADGSSRIQVYIKQDDVGEENFRALSLWDIGDIAGVEGYVFRTRRGEISIHAKKLTMLSKSLLPLPDKWSGLKDTDARYRRRYLDLIMSPDVKRTFVTRSQIMREIRAYLDGRGFIEVETPVLHTLDTGAEARPFKTHHNTLDLDMFLRIETELHLKRLIAGGFERVYEVGRIFRNEGMSVRHNPEFTMLELYAAYIDYRQVMELVEDLFSSLARTVCGSERITYEGIEISLEKPWRRLTMTEAVKEYAGIDYYAWKSDAEAREAAEKAGIEVTADAAKGDVLVALFEEKAEKNLIQPTFLYDYPVENSPLTKRKPEDPAFTERFELFINGWEIGNAYSELNDPIDQRRRFERQVAAQNAKGGNAQMDEDFINALEYGMPPTGGLGFGVDRLVMLLTDSASIRDVLLFPTMKPLG